MAPESKEKKRKAAIALPSDAPQKPHKKSRKSLENMEDPAVLVQAAEAVTANGSDKSTKSKHKPRKRAADFLSDPEDNTTNGASAQAPQIRDAETADKPKEKKLKKIADTKKVDSNIPDIRPTTNKDAKVDRSQKSKKAPAHPRDAVASTSDAPSIKALKEQKKAAASFTATENVDSTLNTSLPASSKNSKKHKKAKENGAADAETLTADGVNGVAERIGDEALDPLTNKPATSKSMQVEGQVTAEKELEDEWGSDDDEDDQGAALLAGFDSDGDDSVEDVGLEADKSMPKLSEKASKKIKQAAQKGTSEGPGTVYVGRIPHGFYEHQMREYFSQFGTITRLRLSRNKRTGASKHFAFVEFESDDVAKIVASAMDNYLMFGHILKCKYAPQERLHPETWKGANKRFRKVPYTMLEKKALEAPKTSKQWEKKNEKEQEKREQKAEKMKKLGYEFKMPTLKEPRKVLEERKLQEEEQTKRLEAAQEVQNLPAGASEPPKGEPKDEVALKMEAKKKKKSKSAQEQSTSSVVEATAPLQPIKPTAEEVHLETKKRDKRKEKKAKSKDAKAQQTQLDAQLLADTEATVDEAAAVRKLGKSTSIESETLPEKKGKDETITTDRPTAGKEKKKKSKDAKAGESATPVAVQAPNAKALADKPKKKKRKFENEAEPKGTSKKLSKAA